MADWPYNSAAWKRLRRAKLSRDPLCEYCPPGTLTGATQVDHRKAIKEGAQKVIGGNESYIALCRKHFNERLAE